MSVSDQALVSVVTPVYNGAKYLGECIESVLAQKYSNWEYIILNNASTDETLRIANDYASRDERIRVYSNDTLLKIIANHNRAFSLISPKSKYVKVVSADDWILPECIRSLAELAEAHPSVGVVCSYQLSGGDDKWYVRTDGLPYQSSIVSGREICRAHLFRELDVFGNPTSNLYRADLVRADKEFYPNQTAEADISAIYKSLKNADFGFVHQVLSYERIHRQRVTTTSTDLNAYLSSKIGDVLEYGPYYLSAVEQRACLNDLLNDYYKYLAVSAVNLRGKVFWRFHKQRLNEVGYPLSVPRLSAAIGLKLLDLTLNPKKTTEALLRRLHRGT
jgi:glycosyltransferase involved in cell wall biosynthesis